MTPSGNQGKHLANGAASTTLPRDVDAMARRAVFALCFGVLAASL